MGVFASIYFDCPDCGEQLEAQSKSGDSCGCYDHTKVPMDIAEDCNRHAPYECKCGSSWELSGVPKIGNVSLEVVRA